ESRKASGTIPATTTIPVREALRWITTEGARMLGREDQIGSLTPGKLADLVIINASDLNLVPVHDPVSTVVMQTSLANIEAVMITSLPDDAALRGALLGSIGLIAAMAPKAVLIETSTVSAEASAEVDAAAQARGVFYLRAPVSGNASIVHTGALSCFVSGPK